MSELLCIGNPIVDVFVEIDDTLAAKYGIVKPAQHIDMEKAQSLLQESSINIEKVRKCSGGGAANVAKVASRLGMSVKFCGSIGQDEFASFFEQEMKNAGVSPVLVKSRKKTGLCFIIWLVCLCSGGSFDKFGLR